jgi:hypothetical protein
MSGGAPLPRIMQQLCTCSGRDGFTLNVYSQLWVCGGCGYPRWQYYLVAINSQPPYTARRIKLPPKQVKVRTRGRATVEM